MLFDRLEENGITNVDKEASGMSDDNYNYIGKGPSAYYKLL